MGPVSCITVVGNIAILSGSSHILSKSEVKFVRLVLLISRWFGGKDMH